MFEKMQRAFWKALTPDLVVDEPKVIVPAGCRVGGERRGGAGRCG